jgi:hypothetical protein
MKPTWKIVTHGPSRAFQCLLHEGPPSYSEKDIEELYCHVCHKFHDPEAGAGVAPLGDLEEARKRVNERSS